MKTRIIEYLMRRAELGIFLESCFFLVCSEKRKSINTVFIFSENIFQQVSGNILPEILKVTESCTDKVFTKSWLNYLWRREIQHAV